MSDCLLQSQIISLLAPLEGNINIASLQMNPKHFQVPCSAAQNRPQLVCCGTVCVIFTSRVSYDRGKRGSTACCDNVKALMLYYTSNRCYYEWTQQNPPTPPISTTTCISAFHCSISPSFLKVSKQQSDS